MYFDNIANFNFLNVSDNEDIALSWLTNINFKDNTLYKVQIEEKNNCEHISSVILSSSCYSDEGDDTKYPDVALKINLKKGNYRISYVDGYLFDTVTHETNKSIQSSVGPLNFRNLVHDDNDYYNNYVDIKIKSTSYLHIWVSSPNLNGRLSLIINKLVSKDNHLSIKEQVFSKETIPRLKFIKDTFYNISINELRSDDISKPIPKYPVGTYQVVLNDTINTSIDLSKLENDLLYDKRNFKFKFDSKKLQSLDGIKIPDYLNPTNFYFMLGKIEISCWLDFNNDKFYFFPASYVECFMNLFLPESKIVSMSSTKEYLKFNIVEYKFISKSFKNEDEIKNNLVFWCGIDYNDIVIDEYKLYYYGYVYNLNQNIVSKNIISKYIDIESYFTYIELNLQCFVIDDVSTKIENDEALLDYEIIECKWRVIEKKDAITYNYINWTQPSNWENTNIPNVLKSYINGTGNIKMTKQHFMNITNIIIDENNNSGTLTKEQFKKMNLNEPMVSPYNRFQYWINLKL